VFCPGCRAENDRQAKARWRRKRPQAERGSVQGLVQMPYDEVARVLGISKSTVRQWELSALAKIRNSPQLREAWASLKENGFPILETPLADAGDRLLQYQLGLVELWRVRGLAVEAELAEDVAWCDEQIRETQKKIEAILA
jgi:transcriptional regulator with XRE-family HTH domain